MTAQNILSKDGVMLLAYNTAGQSWMMKHIYNCLQKSLLL